MRIEHTLSIGYESHIAAALQKCGVRLDSKALKNPVAPLINIRIAEEDASWPQVASLLSEYKVPIVDIVKTTFVSSELKAASWLRMEAGVHSGYPQPEEDSGYLSATYDLSAYDAATGMGLRQKAPFQLSGEPAWRGKDVLQLNWVYDEFFVQPQVWETVFQPFGVDTLTVLDYETQRPLKTVVQLAIPNHYPVKLPGQETNKSVPITRGHFPSFAVAPPAGVHICKTTQYFGTGRAAFREIAISRELWAKMHELKVRGLEFTPLEED